MDLFVERFKEMKAQCGLTYPKIAEAICRKSRTIKNYASGESKPDYYGLVALSDLFDVSLDYLVGRSDDPRRY